MSNIGNDVHKDGSSTNLLHGRMTTDAVHRRFKPQSSTKESETEVNISENVGPSRSEHYYCKQCDFKMNISESKIELKNHFESKEHDPYDTCVYCKKPVYVYLSKKGIEIYHSCKYD